MRITGFFDLFILTLAILFSASSYSQTLRVGTTLWPGYEPLYLAQEINAYKQDIRMIHYPSTSEVLRAFKNRTLEAAALTLDEVVSLVSSGLKVEVILVLDISEGADVIMAHPGIKDMQGLIGAKVAVESTAVGAYTLSRALEVHKIDLNKISLVNVEFSRHKDAFENKIADAIVTFEPVRTQLLNAGAIEIFSSKELPGEIVDVLVVHADAIHSHHDEILDMSQGWFKALEQLHKNPISSYEFIASRMKISKQEAKESYFGLTLPNLAENKRLLLGKQPPLSQTFDRLTKHMERSGLIHPNTTDKVTINATFLP